MANNLKAAMAISFNASIKKVWKALTDPAIIKEYLFGTNTITDWQKGSPITYRGEWNGRPYEDKGVIVDIVPGRLLHTTYFSSMRGKEDRPENYNNVIYDLKEEHGHTILTLSQDNIDSEEELIHSEENWSKVLENMKEIVERRDF
jgi:uncharacterized protein YndB with AHSA1/START domain